jgi:hypothetical protein
MLIDTEVLRDVFLEQQALCNGDWPPTDNEVRAEEAVMWWEENADFPEQLENFKMDDFALGFVLGLDYAEALAWKEKQERK